MTVPLPRSECHSCGQLDPVLPRDLFQWTVTTRRVPRLVWLTVQVRAAWEPPSSRRLVAGLVRRYAAGPFVVLAMPPYEVPPRD